MYVSIIHNVSHKHAYHTNIYINRVFAAMMRFATLCVCVCVCVWERERESL